MYTGLSYKLIMPEVFTPENKKIHASLAKSGVRNGRAKVKPEDVQFIRKKSEEGLSLSELHILYPQITTTAILDIINYKTWKNID